MNYLNTLNYSIRRTSSRLNSTSTTQSNQTESSTVSNLENTIRSRFENLSPMELLILINQIRRRMRLSSFNDDESDSHSLEEYIDFRTYPIPIDWEKIENDKGDYFSILDKYGYFGVGLYSSLLSKCKINLDIEEYIASFLKHYWTAFSDKQKTNDLLTFMDSLPSLKSIKTLLASEAILTKEKCLIKIVLDMYERYYLKYDKQCYNTLNNDYLILAQKFYFTCSEEEIKEIWNTLFNTSSNIKDKIKIMKFKLSSTKEGYIKHLSKMKKNYLMLTQGISLSKFIQ